MVLWFLIYLLALVVSCTSAAIDGNNSGKIQTDGCKVTKSCFLIPDSCLTSGDCSAAVSVFVTQDGRFEFEMQAIKSVYVAVGLSDDPFMGADSVVECTHDEDSAEGSVQVYVSYNTGTSNNRIQSGAAKNGVNLIDGSFVNGVVHCRFTRDKVTKAEGVVYDLSNKAYHLLLVAGSTLEMDNLGFHDLYYAGSHNGRLLADIGMFTAHKSKENDEMKNILEADSLDETSLSDSSESSEFSDDQARISTVGCNVTKSCFLIPDACLVTGDCRAAVSVRATDGDFYEFEMQALDSVYVAVGLSDDARMGSDSIVECVMDNDSAKDGSVEAHLSWNRGHKNHRIHSPLTQEVITLLDAKYEENFIYCKFTRKAVTILEGTTFDLAKQKYHLLLAAGSILKGGGIGFHNTAYAGSHNGRLLAEVGMFTHRPTTGSHDSVEVVDAFQPSVVIV